MGSSVPRARQRTRQSDGNAAAITEEVRRTMTAVGIGRRYHDARFAQFDRGEQLKNTLLEMWTPTKIMEGVGITLVGGGEITGDLHMMLARALHLAGTEVRVLGLQAAARELQREDDEFVGRNIEHVGALFIRKFIDAETCPLRQYEVALVEELIDRRLGNNLAVFPWLAGQPVKPWWSESLMEQLGERNILFEVLHPEGRE